MELLTALIDYSLHIDKYFDILIQKYGIYIYLILFFVIFLETGLVIAPFLPGDSLLFIAGTFASKGAIDVFFLFFLLSTAAIIGDSLNYWIGKYIGKKLSHNKRLIKKEYLDRTYSFYDKHGGKTIIIARFVPIIRTFAPFVAGLGRMNYTRFLSFNVVGGIIWVGLFIFGGYFFGQLTVVKNNLSKIIFLIILASVIPIIVEYLRNRGNKKI